MADAIPPIIDYSVTIDAVPSLVWHFLTDRRAMLTWMAQPGLQVEVDTNWGVGSPIVTRGFLHNGIAFENRGVVQRFEPSKHLQYTHSNSLSRLPDKSWSDCIVEFRLQPSGATTVLNVSIHDFATESIYHHLNFYWRGTINIIKQVVEDATKRTGSLSLC